MATNDASNLAELDEEVALTRASTIATKSRASYLNSTVRMLTWMLRHKPLLVPRPFRDALRFENGAEATKTSILTALSSAPENPPLLFNDVKAADFLAWILSMKNKSGGYHSFSTYAGHRSAFYNLFRDYHCTMTSQLERELSCHFKGLQHRIAGAISSGDGSIKVGKDPMTFGLYRRIAEEMMKSSSRDMVFARTFLLVSWNLMARAANTVSLCYDNISATGIPPHVVLLSEFRSLKAAFEKQQVDQQNVVNEVVAGVRLALEDAVDIRNTPNSNQIATTVIDYLHREGYVRQRPDEDENYAPGVAQ
ncbi:hypothetical protein AM588_10002849 [Phytophthora nicotianae]|uniref:Uncharacterized protein n=1 Tax=Phytophthora nicotianae TaxID=4792 RepID=A0A0W8D302_PHYNI|nr:hypothetical protein AM588_10002849 [Phytophthora nicotianae]